MRARGITPQNLAPGNCPPGTSGYQGADAIYACRNAFDDYQNYSVGLRYGIPTNYPPIGNDGNQPITKGFGLHHAQTDHNIGPHSISLIVADTPEEYNKEPDYRSRVLYQLALVYSPSNIREVLNVVVQKAPDSTYQAPDRYDFGVITAFCSVGVYAPGHEGYCSSDLPAPFNGGKYN